MDILTIFLALALVCTAVVLRYLLKNRGYLESLGIPVVKPVFIFGSPPFFNHKISMHEHINESFKKYGKTYARYEGREPSILTIDPELIKCIMVKNFESFSDTIDWELADDKITLDLSSGEKWKALRKALTPTFTSGKLKTMLEPMDSVVDNLLQHLDSDIKKNPVVEVKKIFQSFALDTISVCAFGINTNSFENDDNQILRWGQEMFSGFISTNWLESGFQLVMNHFTFLTKFMNFYPDAYEKLYRFTKQIIEERELKGIEKEDFIGRLGRIIKSKEPLLTPELVVAQGVIFFVAGYETTSNALSTLSFNLAKHQDIQVNITID
jgi:cytochrome P450